MSNNTFKPILLLTFYLLPSSSILRKHTYIKLELKENVKQNNIMFMLEN